MRHTISYVHDELSKILRHPSSVHQGNHLPSLQEFMTCILTTSSRSHGIACADLAQWLQAVALMTWPGIKIAAGTSMRQQQSPGGKVYH